MSESEIQTQPPFEGGDSALAAEYTLGLLSPAEAAAFEARLVAEPALRASYAAWAESFSGLARALPDVAPPAALRAQVLQAVASDAPPSARGWLWGLIAAGAVAAMALVIVAGPALMPAPKVPLPAQVEVIATALLRGAEGTTLEVRADLLAGGMVLDVTTLAGAPAPGRSWELWAIAGTAAPVSLGVLGPDSGTVQVDLPIGDTEGVVLAISDEPLGGSPTGAATGAVLAAGPLTGA